MKRLFIFTYPKLTLYFIAIIAAYFFFQIPSVHDAVSSFNGLMYLAIFFAGLLFSAGFSTPIATGFFLTLDPSNIYVAALVGGIGAAISDLGLFSFAKFSFMKEFRSLKRTSFIKHLVSGFDYIIPKRLRTFLVYIFVILVISSPLPDELAVTVLAGFTKVKNYIFMLISYIGNILGIYILLSIV